LETIIRIDGVVDASKHGNLILMNSDNITSQEAFLAKLAQATMAKKV
jgi:hypothetical protein